MNTPGSLTDSPLGNAMGSLLATLADPEAPPTESLPSEPSMLSRLIEIAEAHGVLFVVGRKLLSAGVTESLLSGRAASLIRNLDERLTTAVGQSMLLNHHGQRIEKAFEAEGVSAAIVKGPRFAGALYDDHGDRIYTDVDFLVALPAIGMANAIVSDLGFFRPQKFWDNAKRDQEYKWLLKSNSSVLIELHNNLVHYPALRRRVSFGYEELLETGLKDGDDSVSNLMVAIIHCACGHKFHRLNMLVDVLQAVRRLREGDEVKVESVARRLRCGLETGVALAVVGELFGDERVLDLAERFSADRGVGLGRRLISAVTVIDAQAPGTLASRFRRHAFRRLQQLRFVR